MLFGRPLRREDGRRVGSLEQPLAAAEQRGGGRNKSTGGHSYILSKIPAAPMPPPTHIVTMPYRALRRFISYNNVVVNFAPVQPSGWPSAMAPAVHVQTIRVDRLFLQAREHLGGEGFVQLHEVDLVHREAGQLQHLAHRRNRSDAEPLGLDAGRRECDEPAERRQAALAGPLARDDDDRGGAVARLRGIAGRHRAADVERRPKLRQRFARRVAARPFVDGESDFARLHAIAVLSIDEPRRDRHDLLGEPAAVDGGNRPLMALERKGVLLLPRDPGFSRVVLGDQTGAQIDVGIGIDQRGVRRDLVAAHRDHAHRLGSAGDDRRRRSAHDALRRKRDRLQPGRTESVDRHRRGADGHACPQARNARDVQPLLGLRHRAPENDILDLGGFDPRRPAQRFGDHRRGELVRPGAAQGSVRRLAGRRADGRNNHGILHGVTPFPIADRRLQID